MIKLKSLILEILFESNKLSLHDFIIVGILTYGDEVKSTIVTNADINHTKLGYGNGMCWRFNPVQKTVFWWEFDDIHKYEKEMVEQHLLKKYKFIVDKHLPMIYTSPEIDIGINDPDKDDYENSDQYYHYMSSHPFGR